MAFKVFGKKMDKICILGLSLLGVLLFHLFYGCTICREGNQNMDSDSSSDVSGNQQETVVAQPSGGANGSEKIIKEMTKLNVESYQQQEENAKRDQVAGFDDGVKPIPQSS